MVSYYETIDGRISEIEQDESGCWINCVAPEEDEIEALIQDFNIEPDFLRASLDLSLIHI